MMQPTIADMGNELQQDQCVQTSLIVGNLLNLDPTDWPGILVSGAQL